MTKEQLLKQNAMNITKDIISAVTNDFKVNVDDSRQPIRNKHLVETIELVFNKVYELIK